MNQPDYSQFMSIKSQSDTKASKKYRFHEEEPQVEQTKKVKKEVKVWNFNNYTKQQEEQQKRTSSNKRRQNSPTKKGSPKKTDSSSPPKYDRLQNTTNDSNQQNRARVEKTVSSTNIQFKSTNFIHPEQFNYIEHLASLVLTEKASPELEVLIASIDTSQNDHYAREEVLIFLSLDQAIKGKMSTIYKRLTKQQPGQNLSESLQGGIKLWVDFMLKSRHKFRKEFDEHHLPQRLLMLAQNKIPEIVDNFLKSGDYEEAFIASNLHDRAFREESLQIYKSKKLIRQYNILNSQSVGLIHKSAWLLDLAIVINYFYNDPIKNYSRQIFQKYFSAPYLTCQLLHLALHLNGRQQLLREDSILKLIDGKERMKELKLIFCLYSLRPFSKQYPLAYKRVVQCLIRKLTKPQLFIELLQFCKSEGDEMKDYLHIYLDQITKQNPKYTTTHFNNAISQRISQRSRNTPQVLELNRWRICQQFKKRFTGKQYMGTLNYFIANVDTMKLATISPYNMVLDVLRDTITRFQLVCTYKKDKRSQYYNILEALEKLIHRQDLMTIIHGCQAFVQLASQVFNLREISKVTALKRLQQYLMSKQSDNSTNCLNYLQKIVIRSLKGLDGKIFLDQQVFKLQPKMRQLFRNEIQNVEGLDVLDDKFKSNVLYDMFELARWRSQIRDIVQIRLIYG